MVPRPAHIRPAPGGSRLELQTKTAQLFHFLGRYESWPIDQLRERVSGLRVPKKTQLSILVKANDPLTNAGRSNQEGEGNESGQILCTIAR